MDKITLLKNMTDETDLEILSAYLDLAESAIITEVFPFGTGCEEMPEKYESVQVRIAAYYLNKRGAEGETVHLENSVSRHYERGDLPASLLCELVPKAGVL